MLADEFRDLLLSLTITVLVAVGIWFGGYKGALKGGAVPKTDVPLSPGTRSRAVLQIGAGAGVLTPLHTVREHTPGERHWMVNGVRDLYML